MLKLLQYLFGVRDISPNQTCGAAQAPGMRVASCLIKEHCCSNTTAESESFIPDIVIQRSRFPCTTCTRINIVCDRSYPRCAHCLREQTPCFYILKRNRKKQQLEPA
ncbi:hypothetical protein H112_05198 [Trichophyton rubrum D6]|uniref:Zn(2)-C6 fungal-type domain-containing protein n=3 Tax=Trichophyton TaxID=5550 RepID=A0A080WFF4_TRIRC|nr:uncharacterized protein TERG_11923 [Trichophyton rubrum CBS 118892]EZF20519.1 hypothetical protein H100_05220 [Trichophyton rubrum MR850]EZF40936.1 hypothetical protein H102_05207 [Trichophyton rubrum CBS 100081]EZF51730.1 hypothetical protein H103_05208 [Trichophyton rubrum CBS 288.86]EZF62139.1 hypothetical protein H104_05201 [Trichophyton rubrum CBS 289.86]EZF72977.1 hypothetical protein H105_05229 [Trichophyton soudanense CBS 452.61]EZF83386.1 hypothetical protein H110_05207 [Trichophy